MRRLQLALIVILLLLEFFIRVHNPTRQEAYLDEGFHLKRAEVVYDLDEHPARSSHGKLGLYFWLGLFQPEPPIALPVGRMGISIFALITGAAIYAVGRRLYNAATGLVALGLYCFIPLAFFYEGMAMADPITAGLAALIVWRSVILAQRPRWREGVGVGVLLALATITKLNMGLTPFIPVVAILLYGSFKGRTLREQLEQWIKTYGVPLSVAAVTMVGVWLPIAIPAFIADQRGDPFNLVDSFNVSEDKDDPRTPEKYWREFYPLAEEMLSPALFMIVGVALVCLVVPLHGWADAKAGLMLWVWLIVLVGVLPYFVGRLITMRYFMAAAPPIAVIVGRLITSLQEWKIRWLRWVGRLAATAGVGAWLAVYAVPFAVTSWNQPDELPFERGKTNFTEYISGFLTADAAVQQGVETLGAETRPEATIYVTWWLCHLMYLSAERNLTCLDYEHPLEDLRGKISRLPEGEAAYIALSGYAPLHERIDGLCAEKIGEFQHPRIRTTEAWRVRIWRVWRGTCSP